MQREDAQRLCPIKALQNWGTVARLHEVVRVLERGRVNREKRQWGDWETHNMPGVKEEEVGRSSSCHTCIRMVTASPMVGVELSPRLLLAPTRAMPRTHTGQTREAG